MDHELDSLLKTLEPPTRANERIRFEFGLACVRRVEHLLEDPEAKECLDLFAAAMLGASFDRDAMAQLALRADRVANAHQGSRSLDGVGHAAVSASYAAAKAIAGQARQAAQYAAYASVYGQGGYGATTDADSFVPEYRWQAGQLRALLRPPLGRRPENR